MISYKFYRNTNTGELVIKDYFPDILDVPSYFYNSQFQRIKAVNLNDFIEVGEKEFNELKQCETK